MPSRRAEREKLRQRPPLREEMGPGVSGFQIDEDVFRVASRTQREILEPETERVANEHQRLDSTITGGTSGIGRAAANKLAQLGIHVLLVGRNTERGRITVGEIRSAEGEADFISSDLRDVSSVREVARKAVELGNGHVDILINNVGLFPFGPTQQTTEEMVDSVYSLNVKAPYFLVGELAPLMARRGKGAISMYRRWSPTTGCRA